MTLAKVIGIDDWLVFAATPDGTQYFVVSEMWPEWGVGEDADRDNRIPFVLARAQEIIDMGGFFIFNKVEDVHDGLAPDCWRGAFERKFLETATAPWKKERRHGGTEDGE